MAICGGVTAGTVLGIIGTVVLALIAVTSLTSVLIGVQSLAPGDVLDALRDDADVAHRDEVLDLER